MSLVCKRCSLIQGNDRKSCEDCGGVLEFYEHDYESEESEESEEEPEEEVVQHLRLVAPTGQERREDAARQRQEDES